MLLRMKKEELAAARDGSSRMGSSTKMGNRPGPVLTGTGTVERVQQVEGDSTKLVTASGEAAAQTKIGARPLGYQTATLKKD